MKVVFAHQYENLAALIMELMDKNGVVDIANITFFDRLEGAKAKIEEGTIDALIVGVEFSQGSGFNLLRLVKIKFPNVRVVVLSGDHSNCVDAALAGADLFLPIPFPSTEFAMQELKNLLH